MAMCPSFESQTQFQPKPKSQSRRALDMEQTDVKKTSNKGVDFFVVGAVWFAVLAVLALLLYYLGTRAYDSDLAILTGFAMRMLEGHKFSEMYYEPNPPLSIIIYAPVAMVYQWSNWPVYYIHFAYTLVLLGCSFGAIAALLRRIKGIAEDAYLYHLSLAAFLISQVGVPMMEFGDRDHLIILGLVPFLLLQIVLYQGGSVPARLKYCVLTCGAIAVLIKPHYGLIPVAFMAYRFVCKDGFRVMLGADFLALSIGVITYALVLWLFFYDYVTVVFADSILLYMGVREWRLLRDVIMYGTLLLVMTALPNILKMSTRESRIIYVTCCVAGLLLIPYVVQGKGFIYHRIPYLSIWGIALALVSFFAARRFIHPAMALMVALSVMVVFVGFVRLAITEVLSHKTYTQLPLSQALHKHCPDPCSFLLLDDHANNIHRLAIYHEAFHASRFTSMWFLPLLITYNQAQEKGEDHVLNESRYRELRDKYNAMVAEDLHKLAPKVILSLSEFYSYPGFDILAYFSQNPAFADEFQKHYRKVDAVEYDFRIYYPEMQISEQMDRRYDIYVRTEGNGSAH